jgi:dihydrofolate synthase / folylpolyglutamate synthase
LDAITYLLSLEVLGMKFGLENMHRLCARLGHPEDSFRSVIVAGTNGKGSVTAMVSAGLHAAGKRVGRYTSPHLLRLEERFSIDEAEVSTADLEDVAGAVRSAVESLQQAGELEAPATFFECTTAAAFELFRRKRVEIAVLEVGLGGRLDATNVVTPIAAAITSIALDHQVQLGSTIASVAREKAGVIKEGIPVVCGRVAEEAARVIEEVCRERNARLIRVDDAVRMDASVDRSGTTVTLETRRRRLEDVRLALAGRHQAQNAAIALALLDELDAAGFGVTDAAALAALTHVRWPARLERFRYRDCDVLLDAAHNPAGARVLTEYLRDIGWDRVTLIVGAMRDKDIAGMLRELLPRCAKVIATQPPSPRAATADEIAVLARELAPADLTVETIADPALALDRACSGGTPVVAAGSIFLIGPLRGILR